MFFLRIMAAALPALAGIASANGQTGGLPGAEVGAMPVAASACDCVTIPALTPVEVIIDAAVGSKVSKTGDTFPLRLARPIVVNGNELLPAGFTGQGEVVHAKKAGGMGAAGELVLAARFLTVWDRRLRLRSMQFVSSGKDAIHTVDALNAASAASPLPVGLIGFFVSGQNILMPAGTFASAKTAEDFSVQKAATQVPAGNALPATQSTGQPAADEGRN